MWIMMKDKFFSIVEDRNNAAYLMVRSRMKGEIESVFSKANVRKTDDGDYTYRASIPRKTVGAIMATEISKINYPSFKDEVEDVARHDAYMSIWWTMLDLAINKGEKKMPAYMSAHYQFPPEEEDYTDG